MLLLGGDGLQKRAARIHVEASTQGLAANEEAEPHLVAAREGELALPTAVPQHEFRGDDRPGFHLTVRGPDAALPEQGTSIGEARRRAPLEREDPKANPITTAPPQHRDGSRVER